MVYKFYTGMHLYYYLATEIFTDEIYLDKIFIFIYLSSFVKFML